MHIQVFLRSIHTQILWGTLVTYSIRYYISCLFKCFCYLKPHANSSIFCEVFLHNMQHIYILWDISAIQKITCTHIQVSCFHIQRRKSLKAFCYPSLTKLSLKKSSSTISENTTTQASGWWKSKLSETRLMPNSVHPRQQIPHHKHPGDTFPHEKLIQEITERQ